MNNDISRTFDLLERYKKKFIKDDVFVAKQNGVWTKYSTQQYIDYSYFISYGLLALGFKKGDKIITITKNRPEWNFVDMGMSMIGVIHVPVFANLNKTEYQYIFKHSDAKMAIVPDKKFYNMLKTVANETDNIERVYTFEKTDNAPFWEEIKELGKKNNTKYSKKGEEIKKSILPEDFASLIYTSGTTGQAKGVMLSHKNMVHNAIEASKVFMLKPNQKYLSILPLCHVGGRMGNYQTQYSGCSIYYAENMGAIAKNMQEIKPDGFDVVPRILEKIYDTVIAKGEKLEGFKKKLFFWAVKLGLRYNPYGENGFIYEMKMKIADKLIFSKWREALGGNVKIAGCGGASLQTRLERIFWAAGLKIVNMYGLTETSPIITINRTTKGNVKLGTVGKLIDGVKIKIADDGEILCKGDNVMLGYYKNPELTKAAFDDEGWFKTGDIGEITNDNFLKITDRKKAMFKLSNGKYIAPQVIENKFKESLYIEQIMVTGEHEKFAGAIISPNFKIIKDWCAINSIRYESRKELIKLPQVYSILSKEVEKLNKELNKTEKILRFKLVSDEWTPETGELSPTLKLKRKFIGNKYKDLLQEVYIKKSLGDE